MRLARLRVLNVPVTAAPGVALTLGPRFRLCGWSLAAQGTGATPTSADAQFAAAAAGTLTLTGFTTVGSVTVTPAAAWPAGVNQVTVTNVTGGTTTVDIEGGTENPVVITYVPPVGVTGTPVVSVPAIVAGPAYSIVATGTSGGTAGAATQSAGTFADAGSTMGQTSALAGLTDNVWLTDMGVEITSTLTLTVNTGSMSGCVYVREAWPDADNDPYPAMGG
jgi:hypothetical protein